MRTSSYFTYFGAGRIGISRGMPASMKGKFPVNLNFAPTWAMLKMNTNDYLTEFDKILSRLDAEEELEKMIKMTGCPDPVLLCYEKPPFTESNWCHRRIVAGWFEEKLGIIVPEIGEVD